MWLYMNNYVVDACLAEGKNCKVLLIFRRDPDAFWLSASVIHILNFSSVNCACQQVQLTSRASLCLYMAMVQCGRLCMQSGGTDPRVWPGLAICRCHYIAVEAKHHELLGVN